IAPKSREDQTKPLLACVKANRPREARDALFVLKVRRLAKDIPVHLAERRRQSLNRREARYLKRDLHAAFRLKMGTLSFVSRCGSLGAYEKVFSRRCLSQQSFLGKSSLKAASLWV